MSTEVLSVSLTSNSSSDSITIEKCEEFPESSENKKLEIKTREKKNKKKRPRSEQFSKLTHKQERLYVEMMFEGWTEKQKIGTLSSLIEQVQSPWGKYELLTRLENILKVDPVEFLPPELSLNIFEHLDRKDLARAAQVSTQWRSLAYDKTLLLQKIKEGSFYCLSCYAFLGREDDILNRKFRLDYSLAYNVKTLCNVNLGQPELVNYSTGQYEIARASCRKCSSALGVKYLKCFSDDTKKRHGTFLVKKKTLFFPGEPAHLLSLSCKGCNGTVAKEQDIIDWNYVLRGGEAYLISKMINVYLGSPNPVNYTTGNYTVAETFCTSCKENLGVKYIEAPSGKNAFKIGTYLIEKPKLRVVTKPIRTNGEESDEKKKQRTLFSSFISFFRKKE